MFFSIVIPYNPVFMKSIYVLVLGLFLIPALSVQGQQLDIHSRAQQAIRSLKSIPHQSDTRISSIKKEIQLKDGSSQKVEPQPIFTTDALFDVQFLYNVTDSAGVTGGVLGIAYTGEEFWISRFNADTIYRFAPDGTFIGTEILDLPGSSGATSFTFDGTNVYAANDSTFLYGIDPTSFEIVDTVDISGFPRALYTAFDPEADGGNGGFYFGNFTNVNLGLGDIFLVDREGAPLDTILATTHGLSGIVGAAVDRISPGGPFLWVSDQGGDQNAQTTVKQLALSDGQPTGFNRDVTQDISTTNSLSGDIFIIEDFSDTLDIIATVNQGAPHFIVGYELDFELPEVELVLQTYELEDPIFSIPVDQIDSVGIIGSFVNLGSVTVDSVSFLTLVVDEDFNIVGAVEDTFLNVAPRDTIMFTTENVFFPPPVVDEAYFFFGFLAPFDTTIVEFDTTNNDLTVSLGITDSTYIRDFANQPGDIISLPNDMFPNAIFGNNYPLNNQDAMTSITFFFAPFEENLGDVISASLFSVDPLTQQPQTFLASTVPYVVSQEDIDLTNQGSFSIITLPLATGGFTLPPGDFYVGVNQGNNDLNIGIRDEVFRERTVWVGSTNIIDDFIENEELFIDGDFVYIIQPNFSFCDFTVDSLGFIADDGTGSGQAEIRISGANPPYNYLWSNGQTDSINVSLAAGTYVVNVFDQRQCQLTRTIEVPLVTSIEDQIAAGVSALAIYPNPSEGSIRVDIDLREAQAIDISISTVAGQIVRTSSFTRSLSLNETLDLSDLNAGLYLINIETEKGSVVKKISLY